MAQGRWVDRDSEFEIDGTCSPLPGRLIVADDPRLSYLTISPRDCDRMD
jgi:hypothetical protein